MNLDGPDGADAGGDDGWSGLDLVGVVRRLAGRPAPRQRFGLFGGQMDQRMRQMGFGGAPAPVFDPTRAGPLVPQLAATAADPPTAFDPMTVSDNQIQPAQTYAPSDIDTATPAPQLDGAPQGQSPVSQYSPVTVEQLHRIFPQSGNLAQVYVGPLNDAMSKYGINTPYRQAAFLAQVGVESNQLRSASENLNYSAKRLTEVWPKTFPTVESAAPYAHNPQALANLVYANKYGNGDQGSGDGYAYRGGGLMQTTFRDNYRAAGYEDNPDLLRSPAPASDSAANYWRSKGLNGLSDAPLSRAQFDQITRAINARKMGADERWALYQNALTLMGR